jgi:hypothetical protein
MNTKSTSDARVWISAPSIAARFDVSDKTITRWERDPRLGFPRATLINKRRFFRLDEVEAWERSQASHNSAAAEALALHLGGARK